MMFSANWEAAFWLAASATAIAIIRCLMLRRSARFARQADEETRKATEAKYKSEVEIKDAEIKRLRTAYRNLRLTRTEDIECAKLEGYQRAKAEYDAELETRLKAKKRNAIHGAVEAARKEA